MFGRLGVPVLSADDIAKSLMQSDASLRKSLVSLLGPAAYDADGKLDKKFVASKIFSDPKLQQKTNALVHPRVEAEVLKQFVKLGKQGHKLAMMEAALIFEAGFERDLDYVIVVDAPEKERISRVVDRDRSDESSVGKRIRSQAPPESKVRKADYVIRNTGSIAELQSTVHFLFNILQNVAGKQ